MTNLKVVYYPNNEVRVAVYPGRLPKDYLQPVVSPSVVTQITDECDSNHTPVNLPLSDSDPRSGAFNIKSKVDRVPRKLHLALSRYGRRQILRAGSCFSKAEGTERLLLTGTLPGSTQAAFRAIAQNSTSITKKLTNWINYHEPSAKWIYTWEFQGRGALHLHLVCEVSGDAIQYIKDNFKNQWIRLIDAVGRNTQTDMYQRTSSYSHKKEITQADVTVCEREPSRYISKYISKSKTSAHGFWRFPPRQWYQVSRSLLKELRAKTQTFLCEGLSYRAALVAVEEAQHNLSSHTCSGWRRFQGSVLAWSGYGYSDTFNPTDWHKNLMAVKSGTVSIGVLAKNAITMSKNYPQIRCWMRNANANVIENGMLTQTVSVTEMLLLIQTVMDAICTSWDRLVNKNLAAHFMKSAISFWDANYSSAPYTPQFRAEIDKICDDYLTSRDAGTKVS